VFYLGFWVEYHQGTVGNDEQQGDEQWGTTNNGEQRTVGNDEQTAAGPTLDKSARRWGYFFLLSFSFSNFHSICSYTTPL
jgi:hypothetical protein